MMNDIDEDITYNLNDKNELQIQIKYKGKHEIIETSKLYSSNKVILLEGNKYMKEKNIQYKRLLGTSYQFTICEKSFSFFISLISVKIYKSDEIYYICNKEHLSAIINTCPEKFKFYKHQADKSWKNYNEKLLNDIKFFKSLIFTNDIYLKEYDIFFDTTYQMYDNYKKINSGTIFVEKINPLILSINFLKYFPIDSNSIENIEIIFSPERQDFYIELYTSFIDENNNDKHIFKAYTGPYGIGKSFTVLMFQKVLYFEGFKTLYINLKYYNSNDSFNEKFDILLKEIFYLFFKKDEYEKFLQNNFTSYDNIYDAIHRIINLLNDENEKYLIIFDQYQEKYDPGNRIHNFRKICKNILLISSINDGDVKSNIEKQLREKDKDEKYIEYTYLSKLIIDKRNIKELNDTKKKIIEYFGYLPIYQYRLKKLYNFNFLDFYQKELIKIFSKIEYFFKINESSFLNKLYNDNYINLSENATKKAISLKKFLDNINLIPLKYINYLFDGETSEIILYYAFPLIQKIVKEYFKYNNNFYSFYNSNNSGQLGNTFEEILLYDFIVHKLFRIDAFLEVDKIIDMNPSEITKDFRKYYQQKKRILIIQEIFEGEYFDFGIVLTAEEVLILIQAKYKISEKLDNKEFYSKKAKGIKDKVEKKLGLIIKTVHLIFFSSVEYNSTEVFEIIDKKNIECYFYSPKLKYFFRNLLIQNPIEDFILTTKTKLSGQYINSDILFTPIKYFYLNSIPQEAIDKEEIKYINQINNNIVEDKLLQQQYEQFINYLTNNHFFEKKIVKFGIFLRFGEKYPYEIYQFNNIEYYLLICKINERKEINFKIKSFVIFCENQVNYIYDLISGKRENKNDFENDLKLIKYNFFQGYWNNK